ncbi:hypothetical protein PYCCODRAFT_1436085 [Trametes coccinea BRFM310]|uniref:Uncharacterized protein n=1 Tax=Trametes coccinea (strain BRFM310) TaxID=1353009 RepID=A0A1Y2IMC9_TRAC3|nr:hypothetical protein PYCCODRAFT_1436085 [Trametes coccinea BRFM310]
MAIIIAAGVFYGRRLRRRHRGASTVSPLREGLNASQISIEAVALAPSALSDVSRPSSVVLHLQSTEGHLVDTALVRWQNPDDTSVTYPSSHSEIAPSKIWSDSSLPPYSP